MEHAILDTSTSGTTIVNPVEGKIIRVMSLIMISSGSVNVQFQSSSTTANLSGTLYLTTNSGCALPENPNGWFDTPQGEGLIINLSASTAIGGSLNYALV